ncbi:MAG TPA: ABC transporter substrate-binding protein [Actinomycetota bacterium]|nr:ABC transporter substrate-binding protein [Actinomycetota bacterium]
MTLRRLVSTLAAAALLGGCTTGGDGDALPVRTPAPVPSRPPGLVVGLVGTMSGPDAWRGEDAFRGADVAVHVLNRARGDAAPFELVGLDDEGDPARAIELVERLAASSATVGVVYAGPPDAAARAEGALAAAGIPLVACYGDLFGAGLLDAHLFQVAPSLTWEAAVVARYLAGDRGYERVGAVSAGGPGTGRAVAALEAGVEARGASWAGTHDFDPALDDPGHALAALRRARAEAVVTVGGPAAVSEVVDGLAAMGSAYRSTRAARLASARGAVRRRRVEQGWWHPQVAAFDAALRPGARPPRPGTVAAETYARGAHYLPVASFRAFRRAFREWWDEEPLGWELRAYEATAMIGWAADRAGGGDVAVALEGARGRRFGGLDVTFGRGDHVGPEPARVGLWVVPSARAHVRERHRIPPRLPWVPLARTFSAGGRSAISPADRDALLGPRGRGAPGPRTFRFGVRSGRSDPVH